ncbi:MAG TPA: Type 1 glutamine amidotransferase-like domain-containing protein [Actinomycetota bacterium]|nr:Type 1 glutamine amidotransferase-like domain-containing protein [Actinomycetota bacterium]
MTWWSLLGSGEFLPWSEPVDRRVVAEADGDGRVLILPTASAPEGKDVFERWGSLGLAHFSRLDIPAEVLDLRNREDADDPRLLARLDGASAVYFSGGNPAYLSATLAESDFLDAMLKQMDRGMAYAGCSAGVACLNEITFDSDKTDTNEIYQPGLGIMPGTLFAPHWDIVDTWMPGASDFIVASVPEGSTFVGMDENTAMIGNGSSWEVVGTSGIHVLKEGAWASYRDGDPFELALI